jgi:hypothetical protein
MAFNNPHPTHLVGVLQLVRCNRVPALLTGNLARLENSWPIACIVTASEETDSGIRLDTVEIRIGLVFAGAFLKQLDDFDGQVVNVKGIRWNQRDDVTNQRHLIDVMFDPVITLETG